MHNRVAAAFSLFVSAGIYAVIFGYLYWDRFVNIDRKLDLKRYVCWYVDGWRRGKDRGRIFMK